MHTRGRLGYARTLVSSPHASRKSTEQAQYREAMKGSSEWEMLGVWGGWGLPGAGAAEEHPLRQPRSSLEGRELPQFPSPLQAPASFSWAQPSPHSISQSLRKWRFLFPSSSPHSSHVKFFMICFLTVRAPRMLAAACAFCGDSCGAAK